MMTPQEVKGAMARIAGDQLEISVAGVHWSTVLDEFRTVYANVLPDMAAATLDDYLRDKAIGVCQVMRRTDNGQLELPGIGHIDGTVTTSDGEGGYVVKRIKFATISDLEQDFDIQQINVDAATKALLRAEDRNKVLIPVMQAEGFATAGEAIAFIGGVAA